MSRPVARVEVIHQFTFMPISDKLRAMEVPTNGVLKLKKHLDHSESVGERNLVLAGY
jgi:hypothetical protein